MDDHVIEAGKKVTVIRVEGNQGLYPPVGVSSGCRKRACRSTATECLCSKVRVATT